VILTLFWVLCNEFWWQEVWFWLKEYDILNQHEKLYRLTSNSNRFIDFHFFRKFYLYFPLRDGSKNEFYRNTLFMFLSFVTNCSGFIKQLRKFSSDVRSGLRWKLFFDPPLEGSTGKIFEKNESRWNDLNLMSIYTVFYADSEYHILLIKIIPLVTKIHCTTLKKESKSRFTNSFYKIWLGGQCFFLDIYISFCSPWKTLSIDNQINLVGSQNSGLRHPISVLST
jgi:hypothetical protein